MPQRYGHFTDDGNAFRVTDPDTPTPWTNIISNGRYGIAISQAGGGFSWLDHCQLNVLTRWEMDLTRDRHGKFLYLHDRDDQATWSLAPQPVGDPIPGYACTHTTGASTFHSETSGIHADWTLAVAPTDPVELWQVTLHNITDRPRNLRIASYFEWCCGVAPDTKREFHKLFFTTRHDRGRRAIFAQKNMWDVPTRHEKEHWNRPWPYTAAHAVVGQFERDHAIADKTTFLGRNGRDDRPAALRLEQPVTDGFGRFGDACASLGGDFTLQPGDSQTFYYLLVASETEEQVTALLDRYGDTRAAADAVEASTNAWTDRLSPTRVSTARDDVNAMVNTWLPYQAISARLWGRTGYYQQSGAFGYRDQLQDSQVWLAYQPRRCREQILHHAAHQFANGAVYHWWNPLIETGLETTCSDDYLWLPFVTASYIRETGDRSILDATAPFVDDPAPVTLADHCTRAIDRALGRLSERGLPYLGAMDWNDGLSAAGTGGKGESVWLSFFLGTVLDRWADLQERLGNATDAAARRETRDRLYEAANEHAWDGAWFRRATTDDGVWLGSQANQEGRIFLNAQTWAILAGAAPAERLDAAWDSVKEHLLRPMGPLLLAPAYRDPDPTVGYITRYAPGGRENGGVYMHAATWALLAATRRRDLAAVSAIWDAVSPPFRADPDHDAYAAEPYVTPGNVDGPDSDKPGRAGWTWYTGSAAWMHRVLLEGVLGLRPHWDGLQIDPCPPASFGRVEFKRPWRGHDLVVRFNAEAFDANREASLAINGQPIDGRIISEAMLTDGTNTVDVTWVGSHVTSGSQR